MTDSAFRPHFMPMAVGSLPHPEAEAACELIYRMLPEIPFWPQLPRRAFTENMYAQYSEGFPGATLDGDRIFVDRAQDLDPMLEALYTRYIANDLDASAISPAYSAGLERFIGHPPAGAIAVKGQVTGPISWGLTVIDQDRRPSLYDEVLADAIAKHLRLSAAWQERELRKICRQTVMFVDEPYMSSFGSAYIAIDREQVLALLEEVFAGLHGLKGVHCCGNTDWSILMSTSVDILNLDAYAYAESLALYPDAVRSFIQRGGMIAWGIVPTNDEALLETLTPEHLAAKLEAAIALIAERGIPIDDIHAASFITPTCGMGSLRSVADAERALELLVQTSQILRKKYH